MTVPTETKVLGINDAKIFELLTDTSKTLTYDTPVDVPAIRRLRVSPSFLEKELKGDEAVLDTYSKLESIEWSFENAKISLDALAVMIGGKVTQGTNNQTYTLKSDDVPSYFKLVGKADYTDAGDIHVVLYKCKAISVEYELQGEEYAVVTASGKAIGTVNNKKIKDVIINKTATDITGS
jgi:phi13 family phage major tail protein